MILAGGVNNGNIASITNNVNTGRSQSFTYDSLNRMDSAQSQATTRRIAGATAMDMTVTATCSPWE